LCYRKISGHKGGRDARRPISPAPSRFIKNKKPQKKTQTLITGALQNKPEKGKYKVERDMCLSRGGGVNKTGPLERRTIHKGRTHKRGMFNGEEKPYGGAELW